MTTKLERELAQYQVRVSALETGHIFQWSLRDNRNKEK